MISAIAVIGKNRELGCDNKLLWDIPDDLAHFKKITSGHPVIMGRKTFESIGSPLPNRFNIIITRDENYKINGCEVVNSIENAISLAKSILSSRSDKSQGEAKKEIFIIGGAQIYKQALPYCDKLYLTLVDDAPKADVFFPDYSEFPHIVSEEKKEYNGLKYKFIELVR
jgi:dihydrofolate reductase